MLSGVGKGVMGIKLSEGDTCLGGALISNRHDALTVAIDHRERHVLVVDLAALGRVDERAEPALAPGIEVAQVELLLALMAGCRTANEVNGRIIRVRQGQTRQLLDIVRGGSLKTYGPKGQTLTSAHRALARA